MKKKIEWYKKRCTASQVYTGGLQYALVSPGEKQCSPFVYCKDFLQDAVQAYLLNMRRNIYRFVYDPKEHEPVDLRATRILLGNSSDCYMSEKIPGCLDFINQFEEKLKIRKSQVFECLNPPKRYQNSGVWLFESSRRWIKSPPMLSLYTLLLRLGFVHTLGNDFTQTMKGVRVGKILAYQEQDRSQLKYAQKGIDRILKFGDRRIFHRNIAQNYPRRVSISVMHNNCGIVGFAQEEIKDAFPHWYRPLVSSPSKPKKKKPKKTMTVTTGYQFPNPIVQYDEVF